jgi:hypothetical protein
MEPRAARAERRAVSNELMRDARTWSTSGGTGVSDVDRVEGSCSAHSASYAGKVRNSSSSGVVATRRKRSNGLREAAAGEGLTADRFGDALHLLIEQMSHQLQRHAPASSSAAP